MPKSCVTINQNICGGIHFMTRDEFFKAYWNGYKLIEQRFLATSRYISVHKENYATFSDEYLDIIILCCSELDSVATQYCKYLPERVSSSNIIARMNAIKKLDLTGLNGYQLRTGPMFNKIKLYPFAQSDDNGSPDWWKDYNHLKHERTEKDANGRYYYMRANLKNALYALAALYLMVYKLYDKVENKEDVKAELPSELFITVVTE